MRKLSTLISSVFLLLGLSSSAQADPYFDSCSERTGINATLIVPVSAMDVSGMPIETVDEFAVFTPSGVCGGRLIWDGANAALAVWGDDPMTEVVEGFVSGDPMTYMFWDASEGIEYGGGYGSVSVTFADTFEDTGIFDPGAIYLASEIRVSTSVPVEESAPSAFELAGNFPNPFNDRTTIQYVIPETSRVRLEVYDLLGQRVSVLVDEHQTAGAHEVDFMVGSHLASGVYLYRLQAGRLSSHRKMTIVN